MHGAVDVDTGELILWVNADALEGLVKLLCHPSPTALPLKPGPPEPGLRPVCSLRVEPTAEAAVAIAVAEGAATFTGGPAGLARLAQELWLFGDYNDLSEPGMHAHFEPGERSRGHTLLTEDSASMIVVGQVRDDSAPGN